MPRRPRKDTPLTLPAGSLGLAGGIAEVWLGRSEGVSFTRQPLGGALVLVGGFADVWIRERAPSGGTPAADTKRQPGTGTLTMQGAKLYRSPSARLLLVGNAALVGNSTPPPAGLRVQTVPGRLTIGLAKPAPPPVSRQPGMVALRLASAPPTVIRPTPGPVTLVLSGDPTKGAYAVEAQTTLNGTLAVKFFVDGSFYHEEGIPKYSLFGGDDVCFTGTLGNGLHVIDVEVRNPSGALLGTAELTLTEGPPKGTTIRALVGTVTLGLER